MTRSNLKIHFNTVSYYFRKEEMELKVSAYPDTAIKEQLNHLNSPITTFYWLCYYICDIQRIGLALTDSCHLMG